MSLFLEKREISSEFIPPPLPARPREERRLDSSPVLCDLIFIVIISFMFYEEKKE